MLRQAPNQSVRANQGFAFCLVELQMGFCWQLPVPPSQTQPGLALFSPEAGKGEACQPVHVWTRVFSSVLLWMCVCHVGTSGWTFGDDLSSCSRRRGICCRVFSYCAVTICPVAWRNHYGVINLCGLFCLPLPVNSTLTFLLYCRSQGHFDVVPTSLNSCRWISGAQWLGHLYLSQGLNCHEKESEKMPCIKYFIKSSQGV